MNTKIDAFQRHAFNFHSKESCKIYTHLQRNSNAAPQIDFGKEFLKSSAVQKCIAHSGIFEIHLTT